MAAALQKAGRVVAPAKLRKRGPHLWTDSISLFPLYSTPRPWIWPTTYQDVRDACDLKRINGNLVPTLWRGKESKFAAIEADGVPPYLNLRLARLKKDQIDVIDIAKLKERLIRPEKDEFFGHSIHMVLDTEKWIALAERDASVLNILSPMPGDLLTKAFRSSGRPEYLQFHPFQAKPFREIVRGRALKEYRLRTGPISPPKAEEQGFVASAVRRMISNDHATGLKIVVTVTSDRSPDETRVDELEEMSEDLREHGAKEFKVKFDDGELHEMLRENYVGYSVDCQVDDSIEAAEADAAKFELIREQLQRIEAGLEPQIPQVKQKPIEHYLRE